VTHLREEAHWVWLDDPLGDEPGFVARALAGPKEPRLMYRATIWALVREGQSTEAATEPSEAMTFRLRLQAELAYASVFIPPPVWLILRAGLKRRVQALSIRVAGPENAVAGVEDLLSSVAAVVDAVLA
jgi:hypothetical protein